jgi:hypothetical protein
MANKDLFLNIDNDQTIPIQFWEDQENGVVQDITGWVYKFTIKPELSDETDDSDAIFEQVVSVHTDAANGLSQVQISQGDLTLSDVGTWLADIRILQGGEEQNTTDINVRIGKNVTNLVS